MTCRGVHARNLPRGAFGVNIHGMKISKWVRRALVGWLLLVVGIAQAQTPAPPPRDSLTIGMVEFPADMHPFITNQLVRSYVHGFARRTVTGFDINNHLICYLCTEIPSTANGRAQRQGAHGLAVHFTLRPGLTWGDGVPLTSHDIALGLEIERQFNPEPGLESVEEIDATNYIVHFSTTRYDFDRLSPDPIPAHLEEAIYRAARDPLEYGRQSLYNRAPETPGLWNGPYLVTAFTPGDQARFTPNPHWTGSKPYFQRITTRVIENTAALNANLLSGDIDTAWGLTLDQSLALEKDHGDRFELAFLPSLSTTVMLPNFANPVLADRRVRQAILSAIDRKTLVEKLFAGRQPVADGILSPAEPSRDPSIRKYPYDPTLARKLLVDAGYKMGPDKILIDRGGQRLSIDLAGAAGIRMIELVEQVLQSQLKAVGIELVLRNEPPRMLLGETVRHRAFQGLVMFSWLPSPDSIPYSRFHSLRIPNVGNSYGGSNYGGYGNPEMDALLTAAQAELDPTARQGQWNRIQTILADDLPVLPLYHPAAVFLQPRWISGMIPPQSLTLPSLAVENWRSR